MTGGPTGRTSPLGPTAGPFESYMRAALAEADRAAAAGEVPVGAVVADASTGEILGAGHNLVETSGDPTAHAEVSAIRDAAARRGGWRLDGTLLVVTLEPCTMCVGAAAAARIPVVVFGARQPRTGALGSWYDLSSTGSGAAFRRVAGGVLAGEAAARLDAFFAVRRQT